MSVSMESKPKQAVNQSRAVVPAAGNSVPATCDVRETTVKSSMYGITRWLIAGSVGTAVTALSVWMLSLLNAQLAMSQPTAAELMAVMIEAPQSDTDQQPEPEPEPEEPEPEIMTVNLNLPTPEPEVPEPLDLNLSLPSPTLAPVRVAVSQAPVTPRRTSAQKTPQPAATRRADEVEQPPRELGGNRSPVYPPRQLQQGVEGQVSVMLLIDEQGNVADVRVLKGADVFRQSVLDVAHTWRFTPARHEGRPVKVWGVKEVQFTLRNRGF